MEDAKEAWRRRSTLALSVRMEGRRWVSEREDESEQKTQKGERRNDQRDMSHMGECLKGEEPLRGRLLLH